MKENVKVAINKNEIIKLLKEDKYEMAISYLESVRELILINVNNSLSKIEKEKRLVDSEKKEYFLKLIDKINNKLVIDKEYLIMDEIDIKNLYLKINSHNAYKKKRKYNYSK